MPGIHTEIETQVKLKHDHKTMAITFETETTDAVC